MAAERISYSQNRIEVNPQVLGFLNALSSKMEQLPPEKQREITGTEHGWQLVMAYLLLNCPQTQIVAMGRDRNISHWKDNASITAEVKSALTGLLTHFPAEAQEYLPDGQLPERLKSPRSLYGAAYQQTVSAETSRENKPQDSDLPTQLFDDDEDPYIDAVDELNEIEKNNLDAVAEPSDTDLKDSTTLYLNETAKAPLLTSEHEMLLGIQMEKGGEAKNKLLSNPETSHDMKLFLDGEAARITLEKSAFLRRGNSPIALALLEQVKAAREAASRLKNRDPEAFSRYQKGIEARKRLIASNTRLVSSIAKYYKNRGLSLLDLLQEGNIGLIKAVERFNPHKGFRFSTYATWWIRQAVSRGVAEKGRLVRIPVYMVERIDRLAKTTKQLGQELGRDPTADEIADKMRITLEEYGEATEADQSRPVSLSLKIGDPGEQKELQAMIEDTSSPSPHDTASQHLLAEEVNRALNSLTPRERSIILLRFGLDGIGRMRSLAEVGKELGITRERVRQIEAVALGKLRQPSHSQKLAGYIE